VSVDPGQIQQVILNFVRNSLDAFAARPGTAPEITIRTFMTGDAEIELGVIDNGPRLPPEARQPLFDPFFSTKRTAPGSASRSVIRSREATDIPMAVEAMQHGAFDFLQKPFRDQDLIDRIQRALELTRATATLCPSITRFARASSLSPHASARYSHS
jgi:phosphoglycerate-specific signal transduction histidine kinase